MVNKRVVEEKLKFLEQNINELIEYKKFSLKQVKDNKMYSWAIERGLQSSIELILDIGNHIISDEALGSPDNYKEVLKMLGDNKVISRALCDKLAGAPGFRNIVIHNYVRIDTNKVYSNLQKAPDQFKEFIKEILEYIK